MDQPIIADGAVLVQSGVIVAIGTAREILDSHRDPEVINLGDAVLLPGLVNAHTHLELSNCVAGEDPGGSFSDWILSVRARMKLNESDPASTIIPATQSGIDQCLKFGVTCVGDISNFVTLTRGVLKESPLRAVSFGEVLGLGKLRSRLEERLAAAIDTSQTTNRLTIGITPHAPYTVDLEGYQKCIAAAHNHHLPLATHLAETPDETEFLVSHQGPFRELWDKLGLWQEPVKTYHDSPLRFADAVGLLRFPSVLAHVNYCSDDELDLLAKGRASVVYCPRTHRYFRHQPHRWREMLEREINVAIGTDSCASSPDLNLVDDLRLMHRNVPEFPCERLWQLATVGGARALGLDHQIGTITAGKHADLAAFQVNEDQPLREVLEGDKTPIAVWCDGELVSR